MELVRGVPITEYCDENKLTVPQAAFLATVLSTVLASLLVALTIIPFLASRMLSKNEDEHGNRHN